MNYQIDCGEKLFDVELEAIEWHYEDNSIGEYEFHGYKFKDTRPKDLIVDAYQIINKDTFTVDELVIISDMLDDDEEMIFIQLEEELENRLENSTCTDDEQDY